jgi:acetyltransferase-like isoleucine patch superfamily enzyme
MAMGFLEIYYRMTHPGKEKMPYAYKRSVLSQVWHTLRKFICQNIAPNCVTNFMRIRLYRLCGFKIGKNVFIGMKCYLDDVFPENLVIEDNVGISYGVYFSCHGRKQNAHTITIRKNAHIGFRACILARQDIEIGELCMIGAMSLVNKSIPADTTAVGVPCKIVKEIGYRSAAELAKMSAEAPEESNMMQ